MILKEMCQLNMSKPSCIVEFRCQFDTKFIPFLCLNTIGHFMRECILSEASRRG